MPLSRRLRSRSLGIEAAPYCVRVGAEVLRDGVDIDQREFFACLSTARALPKTADPSAGDLLGQRSPPGCHGGQGDTCPGPSGGTGRGDQLSADTLCCGWMAIEAARAALLGRGLDDIVSLVGNMIPVSRMILTADTLRYFHMGGRIGKAQHLVGSLLSIKPLIGMEDGVIVPLGRARSRKGAYRRIVEMTERDIGPQPTVKVGMVHVAAPGEAPGLRAMVEDRPGCVEVLAAELPIALGVRSGPGTVGVCYFPCSIGD